MHLSQNPTQMKGCASTLGVNPERITKPGRTEHLLSKMEVVLDRVENKAVNLSRKKEKFVLNAVVVQKGCIVGYL